jgi:small-conductance mechanosensitive channel
MQAPVDPLALEVYHNSVRTWLISLGILAISLAIMLIVRAVLARRMSSRAPDAAVIIRATSLFFMVAVALGLGSEDLTLPEGWDRAIRALITIASVVQVALWGNGMITYGIRRYGEKRAISGDAQNPTTLAALGVLVRGVMWLILILIALDNLGVRITTLVAGLGISGVAVALAVQNILGDLFAAASIVLDKPIVVGDTITVDTLTGTVEHIGLKTVRLRSITGEQLIFSNSDLLKSRIRNWKRMSERAVTMVTRLSYDNPPHLIAGVPALIETIVRAQPQVRFARSHVRALADLGVEVETLYYVLSADYMAYMNAQQAITVGTLDSLAGEGVKIPTPVTTVMLRADATTGADRDQSKTRPAGTTPSPRA